MVVRKFYLFSFVRLVGPILPKALRSIFLTERFFLFNIIFKFDDTPEVRYWNRILGMEHACDYDAYARRERNVFSLNFNVTKDSLFLMSIGIVFHSFGAATEKARVPRKPGLWEQFECGEPQEIHRQMI